MSDSPVPRDNNNVEDDCPLCLEPLPPFWDAERWSMFACCGKVICKGCSEESLDYLARAIAEGTFGRQEEQLNSTCPLCRAPKPARDMLGRIMKDRFDKGNLPLHMYWSFGQNFVHGNGGLERNLERSAEILMLGANKGDPMCQYEIGARYDQGIYGLPKSTEEAKRWLLAATEQGHAIAECCLAQMSLREGNDADYLRYLRGSASNGYDEACYNLGLLYYNGFDGLQKSSVEAIRALAPAAERGHALSMGVLGTVMCKPDPFVPPPVDPNYTKGMHWLRRAAEKGDQLAISNLKVLEETKSSICFRCTKKAPPEKTFLRCSRCRAAWYCSKDCQVQHWKADDGHKQFCIKWGEAFESEPLEDWDNTVD